MAQKQRPENCMCTGNCATCKNNPSTHNTEEQPRVYFGDSPDDLEERTNNFLDYGQRH